MDATLLDYRVTDLGGKSVIILEPTTTFIVSVAGICIFFLVIVFFAVYKLSFSLRNTPFMARVMTQFIGVCFALSPYYVAGLLLEKFEIEMTEKELKMKTNSLLPLFSGSDEVFPLEDTEKFIFQKIEFTVAGESPTYSYSIAAIKKDKTIERINLAFADEILTKKIVRDLNRLKKNNAFSE